MNNIALDDKLALAIESMSMLEGFVLAYCGVQPRDHFRLYPPPSLPTERPIRHRHAARLILERVRVMESVLSEALDADARKN